LRDKRRWILAALALGFAPGAAWAALDFGTLAPDLNSAYGGQVDSLYGLLFKLVLLLFIGTQGALALFVLLFRHKKGRAALYSHGHPAAEWIWTLIPVVLLTGLYFQQKKLWDLMRGPAPGAAPLTVQVFAEQFAWHFRYAGPDGVFGTADDFMTVNQMHVRAGENVEIHESAKDVIHSFFIPQARLKQDAVPGMLSSAWFEMDKVACWDLKRQTLVYFTPEELNPKKVALEGFALNAQKKDATGEKSYRYLPFGKASKVDMLYEGKIVRLPPGDADYVQCPVEIACSQLCGIGHYRMIGYLYVDTPETYSRWWKQMVKDKRRDDESKWTGIWDKDYPQFNQP